ncbi:hypothetical protein O9929_05220 [Vibrio lentus]|nr:hypothetical protein [Vibrio lentus]
MPIRSAGRPDQYPELLNQFGLRHSNGAYIDQFDLDFLRFKCACEDDRLISQQLLLMKVADEAIKMPSLLQAKGCGFSCLMETELRATNSVDA